MAYSTDIPGQVSEFQLKAIEMIAANAVKDTLFVELGSLFGRSSYAWAKSSEGRATIVCIDPFVGNKGTDHLAESHGITYDRETFEGYTSECDNITVIQGFSPDVVDGEWSQDVHLYFDDSVHTNPGFIKNLNFWKAFVVDGGILCGDDYRPRFNDIIQEVKKVYAGGRYDFILIDFMWVLLPKSSEFFNVDFLRDGLAKLGEQANLARHEFKSIHPEGVAELISVENGVNIKYRFSNTSEEPINILVMYGDEPVIFTLDKELPLNFDIPAVLTINIGEPVTKRVRLICEGVSTSNTQVIELIRT